MTITKEEAIQKAVNFVSSKMESCLESRLEIVDHIEGHPYNVSKINLNNSWIIYVHKEELILDGPAQYIVIDKNTGVMNEIIT
jgi:hypothetical protein